MMEEAQGLKSTHSHEQLGVVSEGHLVKCCSSDKKNKRQKKHMSRLQTGADASEADMAGGPGSHPVKCKRVKRKKMKKQHRLQTSADASDANMAGGTDSHLVRSKRFERKIVGDVSFARLDAAVKGVLLKHADTALQFYGKSQDAKLEVLEVLDSRSSKLRLPESESSKLWVHISFTAKPKNAESSDFSSKHFFGELFRDDRSGKYHATYCSPYQPSDDPGHSHDCIFCPPGWKFHPADGYLVGRPPWYIQKIKFV